MFWLVPRPASLKETVSDPSLLTLPLALTKCSFWASACWAMRAKATKTNATTAILLFICCTSPHRDAAPVVGGAWPRARSAMGGGGARACGNTVLGGRGWCGGEQV